MGEDRSDANRPPTGRRVTVQEAAELLGVTVEAVRGRIKRGTIDAERTGEGVYVWVDDDRPPPGHDRTQTGARPDADQPPDRSRLIEVLEDQIEHLRQQLAEEREARRRADTILAQLSAANAEQARTIRAIEAPREPRDAPQAPAEGLEGSEPRPETGGAQEAKGRRSWLRRLLRG